MKNHDRQDLEDDAVWQLVDPGRGPEAGPMFVSNVMRAVRLSEEAPAPWWKRLLAPLPLTAGALAAAGALALMVIVNSGPSPEAPGAGTAPFAETLLAELDDDLDKEILITAAENPDLFSDEELLAMLY